MVGSISVGSLSTDLSVDLAKSLSLASEDIVSRSSTQAFPEDRAYKKERKTWGFILCTSMAMHQIEDKGKVELESC
jgi:hypothetical protein